MTSAGAEPGDVSGADVRGWVVIDKGLRYLATDHGWLELVDSSGAPFRHAGLVHGCPTRLAGRRTGPSRFEATGVVSVGRATAARPRFVVNPPDRVFLGAAARRAVDDYLTRRDYPQIMLPMARTGFGERGEEELRITHSRLDVDLHLLRSPHMMVLAALASGVARFYSWSRSFRYDDGHPSDRRLLEFDQIVVGMSLTTLSEAMSVAEGVVRSVAESIGIDLTSAPFEVRSGSEEPPTDDGLFMLRLPDWVPSRARAVLVARLERAGATVSQFTDSIAIRSSGDGAEVASIVDTAERAMGLTSGSHPLSSPVWRSPLPLEVHVSELGDRVSGQIASARTLADSGQVMALEGQLYLNGYDIADVGIFADGEQFRRNLMGAKLDDGRFSWIESLLPSAPPDMARVGIGWARLLGALLGGAEPGSFEIFPRSGVGRLLEGLPADAR